MSMFSGRNASPRGRVPAGVRLLAAMLLLCIGRASVAVAFDCPDDFGQGGTGVVAVLSPADAPQDGPSQGTEAGVCLCACGCAHGQISACGEAEPVRVEAPAAVPPWDLPEHAPPTPILPLRLRPPLA